MGLRFSKTIRLGKFLRVNLSKSGPSIGLGPSGLNINLSRRGARTTVGAPGTGISYTTQHGWKGGAEADGEAGGRPARASSFTAGLTFIIVVAIILIAVALLTR